MKKDRIELERNLTWFTKEYNANKKIQSHIENYLQKYNLSLGLIRRVFNGSTYFSMMPLQQLCLFTMAFYNATELSKIKPGDWFNEEELNEMKQYSVPKSKKDNVIILYDVSQIAENQFVCCRETYQNMAKLISRGLLTYNLRTQRQSITKIFN